MNTKHSQTLLPLFPSLSLTLFFADFLLKCSIGEIHIAEIASECIMCINVLCLYIRFCCLSWLGLRSSNTLSEWMLFEWREKKLIFDGFSQCISWSHSHTEERREMITATHSHTIQMSTKERTAMAGRHPDTRHGVRPLWLTLPWANIFHSHYPLHNNHVSSRFTHKLSFRNEQKNKYFELFSSSPQILSLHQVDLY